MEFVFVNGGVIFVCDEQNHRIQVFDGKREMFVNSFGSKGTSNSQFQYPYGVCYDDEQKLLFVADTYNHRVQIFK